MVGQQLGHYRILDKLGAGGMGEVYRAHDEVLGRDVAIKVLPEEVATDPERLARFEREAKVLAALNHAHIGAIYGLEQDQGQHFLVLELIEGDTLAEVIKRRPIPYAEAIPIAIQIAQGLEVAHERGVIHRDLKPANVKITPDDEVKILDFGLAKPTESTFPDDLGESPTLTYAPTGVGVLLGTAAYMSPEQVRGKVVDRRTDIWAFGVVLWEMLTGKNLFEGDTVSDVLAATLTRQPDWEGLPDDLPPGITRVLRRCLVHEPKERLHDIADARIELQETLEAPPLEEIAAASAQPRPLWLRTLPWLVPPIALAAGWLLRPVPEPAPLPTLRFEIPLPEGERAIHGFRHGLVLAPGGESLAFVSGTYSLVPWSTEHRIYTQRLDEWQPRAVAGTESAFQPIYSPDGEWLAFYTDPAGSPPLLKKVSTDGGEPVTICECDATFGATWGPDNTLVLASAHGPLKQVSAVGGDPTPLTRLSDERGETGHRLPHFLPDGSAVIFTTIYDYRDWERSEIVAYSFDSKERTLLVRGGSDGRFVEPNFLVFAREGRLFSVQFDPRRLEVQGDPIPVLEGVNHSIYTGNSAWRTGAANFSVSSNGSLVYLPGSVFPETPKGVALIDRQGEVVQALPVEPKQYLCARVSTDGRRALLSTHYKPNDVWLFDFDRGTLSRQTFEGRHGWAVWGPADDELTVGAYEDGEWLVYSKQIGSGPGQRRVLANGSREFRVSSWSPDRNHLALVSPQTPTDQTNPDIWILSADGSLAPFLDSRFLEAYPDFSPDGRWIAYTSNESGRGEVYVRPFPGPGPAVQVSPSGGWDAAWSHDGLEIFYRSEHHFIVAKVDSTGDRLIVGRAVELFPDAYASSSPVRSYDVTPDGQFVVVTHPAASDFQSIVEGFTPTRIQFAQNWGEELEAKVPLSR